MLNLFLFITFAFPKAGIKINDIPITLQIVLFIICIALYKNTIIKVFSKTKEFTILYMLFSFILLCTLIINYGNIKNYYLLVTIVLITSPLAIGLGYKAKYEKIMKIICIALIITGLYSILQWNIGIEKTKIEGLNIAYGDTFSSKPIGYGFDELEAQKMPSTYQNGNLVGIFYILGIACMVEWKATTKKYKKLKLIAILLGACGIFLTGSRTIMISFIIMILLYGLDRILKDKARRTKYLKMASILFILAIIIITFVYVKNKDMINVMINRYITQTIQDKTATGRTILIENFVNYIKEVNIVEKIRILFLGMDWLDVQTSEGLLYIFAFYGSIAFVLTFMMFYITIKHTYKISNIIGIAFFSILIAFLADSSFNYPPILIIYFLIVGIYLKKGEIKFVEGEK